MPKTDRKYSLFLDTTLNKVDAKGRVSIPADFGLCWNKRKHS